MSRNYWVNTHTKISWQEFHERGRARVAGFPNSRRKIVERMQVGDYLLCYMAGYSRWVGLLEVVAEPFYIEDEPLKERDHIWQDVEFRNRVPVKVLISLTSKTGVPILQLRDQLSIFRGPKAGSWKGHLRNNPVKWSAADGEIVVNALRERYNAEIAKQAAQDIIAQKIEEGDESILTGFEGGKKKIYTNVYERNVSLRTAAIEIHGTVCKGCGFDFFAVYGLRGKGYIEVHHLRPISSLPEKTLINPKEDMTVLCSNCHRIVHRYPHDVLTLEQLQALIQHMRQ